MTITDKMNSFYYHMSLYELQMMNGSDYFNGLSYNSLLYINVIEQLEDCTVSKLAQALHIPKSAVTIKINELVRQKLVLKEQSSMDKRVYYLRLSPEIANIMGLYDEIFQKVESDLRTNIQRNSLNCLGTSCRRFQAIIGGN